MPVEHSTINETSTLHPSLKGLGDIVVEGLEYFKSQRSERTKEKQCHLDMTHFCTNDLTSAVIACTRPVQNQARLHSSRDEKGAQLPHPT